MRIAEKLVTRLLETDEVDPKGYAMGEQTLPREISIVGRRWFRKSYGGTYHTATITVDGQVVASTDRQYGYDQQYLETGWQWLEANGYVPRRTTQESPWAAAKDLGIKLDYYATDVKRQRDL
jgi:hypothetical protein